MDTILIKKINTKKITIELKKGSMDLRKTLRIASLCFHQHHLHLLTILQMFFSTISQQSYRQCPLASMLLKS